MPITISGDTSKQVVINGDTTKSTSMGVGVSSSGGGSSDPAYVIAGLEQSHWDVASATFASVSGTSRISSIPDSSAVQNLTVGSNYGPEYRASGWSSNGITLPTAVLGGDLYLKANDWASKISGYTGAYTVAALIIPTSGQGATHAGGVVGLAAFMSTTDGNMFCRAPGLYGYGSGVYFSRRSTINNLGNFKCDANITAVPQLWLMEYTGTSASTAAGQFKFWQNGVSKTVYQDDGSFAQYGNGGRSAITVNQMLVGKDLNVSISQLHIWKGSLTDSQRAAVTTDLMTRGGLV